MSERCISAQSKMVHLHPALFCCWWGTAFLWRRRDAISFEFQIFILFSTHLLWFYPLLVFDDGDLTEWGFTGSRSSFLVVSFSLLTDSILNFWCLLNTLPCEVSVCPTRDFQWLLERSGSGTREAVCQFSDLQLRAGRSHYSSSKLSGKGTPGVCRELLLFLFCLCHCQRWRPTEAEPISGNGGLHHSSRSFWLAFVYLTKAWACERPHPAHFAPPRFDLGCSLT